MFEVTGNVRQFALDQAIVLTLGYLDIAPVDASRQGYERAMPDCLVLCFRWYDTLWLCIPT